MKQLTYIIVLVVMSCTQLWAQQPDKERMEKIHAIKVAYITEKIDLTTAQAEKFWPVYNKYGEEMRAVRKAYRAQGKDPMKNVEDDIEAQEKILDIRKRYKDAFLKVISAKQLSDLYDAERGFKKMLIERLGRQGGNTPGDQK